MKRGGQLPLPLPLLLPLPLPLTQGSRIRWHLVSETLTHWGRVTHVCVGNLTIIGSDNGLSPGRRQAIIWTNAGILLIGPWGTNFSEILIGIQTFSSKKMHLKLSSGKRWLFCLGLNVLTQVLLQRCTHCNNIYRSIFVAPEQLIKLTTDHFINRHSRQTPHPSNITGNFIETERKWPAFCKRHFQIKMLAWQLFNFVLNFVECFSRVQFKGGWHWFR